MTQAAWKIPEGHIERAVEAGHLDHWLAAGPFSAEDAPGVPDFVAHAPAEGGAVFGAQQPVRRGTLEAWQVVAGHADHLVHLDVLGARTAKAQAWLYTMVRLVHAATGTLVLAHSQQIELWVNGVAQGRWPQSSASCPDARGIATRTVTVALQAGQNEIRLHTTASEVGPWLVGARLDLAGDGTATSPITMLPTTFSPVERRENLAAIMADAYVEQDVFQAKERIWVKWPPTTPRFDKLAVRLQAPNRRIYAEGYIEVQARTKVPVAWPDQLSDGRYDLVLMPRPEEYYEKGMRVTRRIPVRTVRNAPSITYYGDYGGRAQEALEDAAKRAGLFAQIAKMALGEWEKIDAAALHVALDAVHARAPGWLWQVLGLLGLAQRFGAAPELPATWREAILGCAGGYVFTAEDWPREDDALAAATVALLAGQLQEDTELTSLGEKAALEWLTVRAQQGFGLWDAPLAYARMVAALSHLADLAVDEGVADMAAVVLDKLLLTLGINSFQGVFGSAHAETTASAILGSGTEATSGIGRVAWGKGTFNHHLLGTVSLACAASYVLPEIVAATAVDASTTFTQQERHVAPAHGGQGGAVVEAHKVTHKTPYGMLSSVLDYNPGRAGRAEHIWQATLGPGVVVFVNHPALGADPLDDADAHTGPGFWRGNAVLPRVAQAEDLLAAWYRLPSGDRMGFTHAYFPRAAFDEHYVTEHWAFARKGSSYVALYASTRLESVGAGPGAQRELRAAGPDVFWLCRLGSADQDGTFQEFRAAAAQAQIDVDAGTATMANLWGRDVTFGWEGPLLLGGSDTEARAATQTEWPLRFADHYAGEFCRAAFPAQTLEINYKGHAMQLELGGPPHE